MVSMLQNPRQAGTTALCVILGLIIIPIVGIRLWTRKHIQKIVGAEDILIAIATIATIGALVGVILAVCVFHYDRHTYELSIPQLIRAGWLLFVAELAYSVITAIIKVAILLFYHRLVPAEVGKAFTWALYIVMAEVILYKTVYIMLVCTSCTPLEARWMRVDPSWKASHHYSCPISDPLNITIGSAMSAVEDLVLAVLPIILLWNLQVPFKTKIGIWFLFSLSLGTSAVGFVRAYLMWNVYYHGHKDYVYWLYWTWLLAMLEVACGLICSSVPALKPFATHYKLESRLRVLFHLPPIRTKTTTGISPTASNIKLFKRQDLQPHIFDGAMTASSLAEVSWVNNKSLRPSMRDRRSSRSLTSSKTSQTVEEEMFELEEAHLASPLPSQQRDSMWINVRSSVTVERSTPDETPGQRNVSEYGW